jgi:hypothetical protein
MSHGDRGYDILEAFLAVVPIVLLIVLVWLSSSPCGQ